MNKTLRADEKRVMINKLESDTIFNRLSEEIRNPKHSPKQGKKLSKTQNVANSIQKSYNATIKTAMISQDKWLKSHGNDDKQCNLPIAKKIIYMLDPQSNQEVLSENFISFLIEIGVPLPIKGIKHVLQCLFGDKNIKNKTLKEEHVSALCRSDKRNSHVLMILNQEIARVNNKRIDDVTSGEQGEIILNWWEMIQTGDSKIVQCCSICEFLVQLEAFYEVSDARKFVMAVCKDGGYMDYCQFRTLFAKAIIKHVLININKKFTEDDWNNPMFSYAYKLSQLKRQLILAGIKYPVPHISAEEGILVLKAIESMDKANGVKITISYEDFKSRWLKSTGINLDKKDIQKNAYSIATKSQRDLAVFYPKNDRFVLEDDDEDDEVIDQKNDILHKEREILRERFKKNTLGFLLFGELEKRAHALDYYNKRLLRPINKNEIRCLNQTELLNCFQRVVNTIHKDC